MHFSLLCLWGLVWAPHAVGAAGAADFELVTDGLPELNVLLKELEMEHLTEKFYSSGFTETKYVMRMKDMDLRIMAMEWGVDKESILKVRETIKNYKVEREVVKEVVDPLVALRNSLIYGKMVVQRSTASYEYYTAYFSAPMPMGWIEVVVPSDDTACNLAGTESMAGKIVLATRGGCSFLDKATNATAVNASALVLVNNGSDLFQIAAGYATGQKSEDNVDVPTTLPMIMVKAHALRALALGSSKARWRDAPTTGGPLLARLVPLRCPPGDTVCVAILPEEQEVEQEVDSGYLEFGGQRVEFLSGTWGGILPSGEVGVVAADPPDGCAPLKLDQHAVEGKVVVVQRGACGFGDKAVHVEQAGGAVMVVVDRPGTPLLRIGATQEQMPRIGIPGMMVTAASGAFVNSATTLRIDPKPGMAAAWLELSMTQFPEKEGQFDVMHRQLMTRNAGSPERLGWLEDARKARFGSKAAGGEL